MNSHDSRVGWRKHVPRAVPMGALVLAVALATPATLHAQDQDPVAQARDLFREALQLAQNGDFEAARGTTLRGLDLRPGDADGLNLLGEILEQLEDFNGAAAAYDRARIAEPTWVTPSVGLGRCYLRLEQYLPAVTALRRAVDLAPDDAAVLALLGTAQSALGRRGEARASFERAWELAPDRVQVGMDAVRARREDFDIPAALAGAERLIEMHPDAPLAWTTLGETLMASPAIDDRIRAPGAYRKAIALRPEARMLWLRLSSVYYDLGLTTDQEAALRGAIDAGAYGSEVWTALGDALFSQSRYEEAVEAFARAIEVAPTNGTAYYRRGQAYFFLGQNEAAHTDMERAIEAMPNDPAPLLTLARFRLQEGDTAGAEAFVERARAVAPDSANADFTLGRVRLVQGREDEAITLLERAVAADVQERDARYLLGQALLKRNDSTRGDLERGRALMAEYEDRMVAQRGDQVEALRTGVMERGDDHKLRGKIYLFEERYLDAAREFEAAAAASPDDAQVWELLAQVYDRLERPDDAATARARAASLAQGS